MKLTFLGTRGYIDACNPRHELHTSLLVTYRGRSVRIDCGETWRGRVSPRSQRPLVITHGHPDHVGGLAGGYGGPIWATAEAWRDMDAFPLPRRHTVAARKPAEIGGMTFEAFRVEHSLRCPAVGYRITAGNARIFYCPDVVYIHEREAAPRAVDIYIGDGASIERSLVRRRGDRLFGHAPFRTQLTWCAEADVPRAVVTHCGSELVAGDERRVAARLGELARERGVEAEIACDRMEIVLR